VTQEKALQVLARRPTPTLAPSGRRSRNRGAPVVEAVQAMRGVALIPGSSRATAITVGLCQRYRRLAAAGKPKLVVITAIAREMVGFIWAIARMVQPVERGSPETKPRSCGSQPEHESLLNRRLDEAPPPARRFGAEG
jgi:hypothetical protein